MPTQDTARSPARRPQLNERPSSSQSLSKGSPGSGNLTNTHKGSSTRLHKTHAVGHARHGHGRVPSYGKGLNKLSKLGLENVTQDAPQTKNHNRSASHSPPASPTQLSNKRNSSSISLNRPGSRGNVKKNISHPNLARNGLTTKAGNQPKSEKAQIKQDLLKRGTNDASIRGSAQFEVGDDGQDDEWTEDSSSQSPATTRTHSRPKTPMSPAPKELPTPDEPPERRSPQLPASPPESPPLNGLAHHSEATRQPPGVESHSFSHPPDAQAVTNRLLNRNTSHNISAQASNISANITPQHIGSSNVSNSQGSTLNEPSMPADGISRFLPGTNSNSGSGTPSSVSQLQQNLATLERSQQSDSPRSSTHIAGKADARRVRSAANLTHPRLNGESVSPEKPAKIGAKAQVKNEKKPFYVPSPFESARGANPTAGKSYTQLKLNLDREAVSRDPPVSSHPLLANQGSLLGTAGATISMDPGDMEKRLKRQYMAAQKDVQNARRYYGDVVTVHIPERTHRRWQLEKGKEKRGRATKGKESSNTGSSAETAKVGPSPVGASSLEGAQRGRIKFDVGKSNQGSRPKSFRKSSEERNPEGGDISALLKRIWIASEPREELDGE
ncbi:uncharacterized protein KY384_002705 [Bacidia gigantensis]|uniref:uncharacterized protein n=1 Tax=Bacidia gigantensis TaxID=2732470 RepID=UPI001D03CCBE|nr:uncharacterized protein KY384_002705 [Bacidia gigantensis]KAG8532827.1 hypothetical protein KY384_002705 [Bacidia gigantensis]